MRCAIDIYGEYVDPAELDRLRDWRDDLRHRVWKQKTCAKYAAPFALDLTAEIEAYKKVAKAMRGSK